MRRVSTQGSAFDRGRQQGQAVADLALPWIERTRQQLGRQQLSDVDRWVSQWEAACPEVVQECHGLAAGLAVPLQDYLIHCCYHRLSGALPQCTVLGVRHDETAIGKTDDIGAADLGMNIMEITRPEVGFAHVHMHYAGTAWTTAGMNDRGLAMGMTGIPGPLLEQDGLFSLLALHTILPACENVAHAVEHVRDLRVNAYGFSLMLADRSGQLALVEKTGAGFHVNWHEQSDPPLAHTNHILQPDLAARNPRQPATLLANSHGRHACASRLLAEGVSLAGILAHRSDQACICQQGEAELHTDYAVILHPSRLTLDLWAGYPAEVEMERIGFQALVDQTLQGT